MSASSYRQHGSRYSVYRPLFQVQMGFLVAFRLKLKVKFSEKMKMTVPSVGRMGKNRTSHALAGVSMVTATWENFGSIL